MHRPKRCEYTIEDEDEDNGLNSVRDKNDQASSKRFWQLKQIFLKIHIDYFFLFTNIFVYIQSNLSRHLTNNH